MHILRPGLRHINFLHFWNIINIVMVCKVTIQYISRPNFTSLDSRQTFIFLNYKCAILVL